MGASVTRVGFAPIVRVDPARREIELCATSEAVDAHGTIFAYAASRDAFARWAGNVREMHERKAVGRRVAVRCDDATRKVYVRVRISTGAEDTWQKVLDGTLQGASIGAANVVWRREGREGARSGSGDEIPIATRYDLVELSLVDLPSNPDALGVTFVRDGVPVAELLDELEEEGEEAHAQEQPFTAGLPVAFDSTALPHDAAEAIAAAALARGRADLAAHPNGQPNPHTRATGDQSPSPRLGGGVGVGAGVAKRARLASLGAPGYVASGSAMNGRGTDGDVNTAADTVHGSARSPVVHNRDRPTPVVHNRDSAPRACGPYSTNPDGAPDMGVPARADERPTSLHPSPREGRDGGGVDDDRETAFHTAARSLLHACGCPTCQMALAALDGDGSDSNDGADDGDTDADADEGDARDGSGAPPLNRLAAARLARTLNAHLNAHLAAHTQRLDASIAAVHDGVGQLGMQLGAQLGRIEQRVAIIEEQPMPGGPQLRVADKTHALAPGAGYSGGYSGAGEQLRALEALAGRLTDPQAQIAVATEMIRLQQEAAGLAPDLQAMPRAGWGGQ